MNQVKLQVFVSSTYEDLQEERQAAVEAILKKGHIPAGMELFKGGKSQMETIKRWIDESDVFVIILGGRYGSIEEETRRSYTELEYNYAVEKKIPIVRIVLSDQFLETKASLKRYEVYERNYCEEYYLFKEKLKKTIVENVENIDQITSAISFELDNAIEENKTSLRGWVKNDGRNIKYAKEEIIKTYKEEISQTAKEEIDKIYKSKYSVSYVRSREEIDKQLNPLEHVFENVKLFNIVTVSGIEFLNRHDDEVRSMLKKDIEMNMVILRFGTEAFREHFTNKLDSTSNLKINSEATWEGWMEIRKDYDKFHLRYTNVCLPYNILYVEKEKEEDSFIKVDLYAVDTIARYRPCLYMKPHDEMYEYFKDQFQKIWRKSKDPD